MAMNEDEEPGSPCFAIRTRSKRKVSSDFGYDASGTATTAPKPEANCTDEGKRDGDDNYSVTEETKSALSDSESMLSTTRELRVGTDESTQSKVWRRQTSIPNIIVTNYCGEEEEEEPGSPGTCRRSTDSKSRSSSIFNGMPVATPSSTPNGKPCRIRSESSDAPCRRFSSENFCDAAPSPVMAERKSSWDSVGSLPATPTPPGGTPPGQKVRTETLIFVDIDGVLNVGIQDARKGSLSFNEANVSIAEEFEHSCEHDKTAEILLAVMRSQTRDGNSSTYGKYLSRADIEICDVFVERLVQIIRAAGTRRRVVISSYQRSRHHLPKIMILEQMISDILGQRFRFDDRTAQTDNETAGDRLSLIGDYIAAHCQKRRSKTKTRVLVLDDFFHCPIHDLECGGIVVNSLKSAEAYLEARVPPTSDVQVRIIHTYDKCLSPSGLVVEIATGLSLQHLGEALAFLDPDNGKAIVDPSLGPPAGPVAVRSPILRALGAVLAICSPGDSNSPSIVK